MWTSHRKIQVKLLEGNVGKDSISVQMGTSHSKESLLFFSAFSISVGMKS